MSAWQPIETAPKDGTEIIVGWPADERRQFRVHWDVGKFNPPKWVGKGVHWSEGPYGPTHWRTP